LAGESIPLEARILAVADAFDAMTSIRPYRGLRPVPDALEELQRCAGSQFDPSIVDVFICLAGDLGQDERVAAFG
jgi:HD-GYP domain-containing protein (c-di-GMP phosphodiesterase class II)